MSSPHDWKRAAREIRILKRLKNHPAIIHLYDVVCVPEEVYLVQELAQGGSLLDYVRSRKTIPEEQALHFFLQIVAGLQFCHSKQVCCLALLLFSVSSCPLPAPIDALQLHDQRFHGSVRQQHALHVHRCKTSVSMYDDCCMQVAHRDIKLENLLMDSQNNMKVIDFGLAAVFKPGAWLNVHCGSPSYAAPEIVGRQMYQAPPTDVWSLGIVTFAMVAGHLPFYSRNGVLSLPVPSAV